jgi:hypothetical protein
MAFLKPTMAGSHLQPRVVIKGGRSNCLLVIAHNPKTSRTAAPAQSYGVDRNRRASARTSCSPRRPLSLRPPGANAVSADAAARFRAARDRRAHTPPRRRKNSTFFQPGAGLTEWSQAAQAAARKGPPFGLAVVPIR